jgi:hypothetical protein
MLYITYNANNFHNDGMGAQYQRMIAIISICFYFQYNAEYIHTPITKIEHIYSNEEVQQIEDYFGFSKRFKCVTDINYDEIVEYNIIKDYDIFNNLIRKSKIENKNILLKTALIFNIVEKYMYMYENAMIHLRSICSCKIGEEGVALNHYIKHGKNVAIHIRRGDVTLNTTNRDILLRFTPMDVFKNIIMKLQQQKEYSDMNFYIFTELTVENKHEFEIFNDIDNLEIISDNQTLNTFHHLANADVLVTCKSSFSYISAFYNPNIVYYLPFWHQPFSTWKKL